VSYASLPQQNPLSETDALGNATNYGYDALNRVAVVKTARNDETSYSYDAVSQLIQVTYLEGNAQE
jgi:YD repeat-containing protein